MSGPGFSIDDLPSIQEEQRQRINSGRFIRLAFSIHLPKWVMHGIFDKLPEDALLCAASFDIAKNTHNLIFWSNFFDPRPPSEEIEEVTVIANTETREVTLNRWNREARELQEARWLTRY